MFFEWPVPPFRVPQSFYNINIISDTNQTIFKFECRRLLLKAMAQTSSEYFKTLILLTMQGIKCSNFTNGRDKDSYFY